MHSADRRLWVSGLYGDVCQPKWMAKVVPQAADPTFCCKPSASAAFSEDHAEVTLRFVNPSNLTSTMLTVELIEQQEEKEAGAAMTVSWKLVNVSQMSHAGALTDANPMNDTLHISPRPLTAHGSRSFLAPPQSVTVAQLRKE
eukprot:COSAG06_NODE_4039_length_4637_cov_1.773468_2_plen_143_part_00